MFQLRNHRENKPATDYSKAPEVDLIYQILGFPWDLAAGTVEGTVALVAGMVAVAHFGHPWFADIGLCYKKSLVCPPKCFISYSSHGRNFGGGGGGGSFTIDSKRKCIAYY